MSDACVANERRSKGIEPAIRMSYYEVLQVAEDVSPDEIRAAYLRLVQRHHPDRHVGEATEADRNKFKQIQEAYEVLFDVEQRRLYDNQRSIPKRRDRGPVVTPAYRGAAAATQPINPRVRRDVPDDWLRRGSASSGSKKKPIRTLVFVAILIGLATTVVPQCSQYVEQHIGMEEITIPEFNSALGPERSSLPTMALFTPTLEPNTSEQVSDQVSEQFDEERSAVDLDDAIVDDGDGEREGEEVNNIAGSPVEPTSAKEDVAPLPFSMDETAVDLDEIRSKTDHLLSEGMDDTNAMSPMGFGDQTGVPQNRGRSHSRRSRPHFQLDESQGFANETFGGASSLGNGIVPPTWREPVKPLPRHWESLGHKSPTKNSLIPPVAKVDMSLPFTNQQNSGFTDPGVQSWVRDLPSSQRFSNSWGGPNEGTGDVWSGGNSNSFKSPTTWNHIQNESANATVSRFGVTTGLIPFTPPVKGGGFSNGILGGVPAPPASGGFTTPNPWP